MNARTRAIISALARQRLTVLGLAGWLCLCTGLFALFLWCTYAAARTLDAAATNPKPEGVTAAVPTQDDAFNLDQRRREHWAWQPLSVPRIPSVKNTNWVRDPIDCFVINRLERAGLAPAPPTDRRTLIRRLYFDLIGLPPATGDVESFVADIDDDAAEKVVDRLLASPFFGERWGRHWLDLVRYAETRGHEFDHIIPNAYQYRDYVIRAINGDLPYNQFVLEHIAGDLMAPPRLNPSEQFNESILGTGFWFLGEELHSPVDIRGDETDRIDNKIDVYSKTFLGLTVSCARCHDHKFDAISMRDYYGLAGYVLSSSYRQVPFESIEQNRQFALARAEAETKYGPAIVDAVVRVLRPAVAQMPDYLRAVRDVIRARADAASTSNDDSAVIDEVSAKRYLSAVRLRRWVGEYDRVRQDRNSPLYLWSRVVSDAPTDSGVPLAELLRNLVNESERDEQKVRDSWQKIRHIVDCSAAATGDWSQDGVAFGCRLVQPGTVQFGSDPARPIRQVYPIAAACSDSDSSSVQLAPGTERDPAKVGWLQPGRTLRTRTFTLQSGKLYYLIRGSGNAYAAVDSHRLIAGPLHGALTQSWNGDPAGKLQWIEHNLSAYSGHRVHIEFSPADAGSNQSDRTQELAILAICEADERPLEPAPSGVSIVRTIAQSNPTSADSVADAYRLAALQALDRLGLADLANPQLPDQLAWLAGWIMDHPALFIESGGGLGDAVETAARPLRDAIQGIRPQFRRVSHTAPALLDGNGVDENVLTRGNHRSPGVVVQRRFLEAIGPDNLGGSHEPIDNAPQGVAVTGRSGNAMFTEPSSLIAGESGSGRLELAHRMVDPQNPLVARVIVNRVWHHLFGRGIVASVDNFGVLGERPSHPELLDHLAYQFIEHGWSIKQLIRDIVLSNSYAMSSQPAAEAMTIDPQNLLLHHRPVRRLEGEAIRDAVLAVSGRLDTKFYGPSIELHLTPFMDGRGRPAASGPLDGDGRRSVYLRVRRNFPQPMLAAFDSPTPFSTIGRRSVSNVPAQALSLLNSDFIVAEANRWAERVLREGNSFEERVDQMFRTAYARPPTATELDNVRQFMAAEQSNSGQPEPDVQSWADLAHVLFNAKEFIFVP